MGKPGKIVLVVLAAALASLIVWQVAQPPGEPVYKGKRLSEWLPYDVGGGGWQMRPEFEEAVRQAGTKAIPALLRMLRAKDSPFKVSLIRLVQRHHILKVHYIPAGVLNDSGCCGIGILGADAQSAMPELIEIANRKISPQSQVSAIYSLGGLAPSAKEAVPSLLRWATDGNAQVRSSAIEVLGRIGAEGDLVMPVLINALHDPSAEVQTRALAALRKFGPDAHLAVPALVAFLNSLNPPTPFEVHRCAEVLRALQAIDPEAAAKAGITNSP